MADHRLKTMDELGRLSVAAFKQAEKRPVCIVLDNVRSLHNVGSAFRTADAFRIEKLYLCGITATPPHREIHKAALGATESVDWEYREDTLSLVHDLTARGYQVYAVEQTENSTPLQAFCTSAEVGGGADKPLALIFGNEVHGVQQAVADACRGTIEIPQEGTKHSLNVSVSIGIVLWELCRGGFQRQ
ncbi:MAG: RNA methyltransferase [Bacteroidales bacterium]|nr:RNA methyltransferase [Bacteroidales bacterium]MDE5606909.1 RNA methyltransferase [Bacteroidales bacterium]MDE6112223.1 RNA methyltransferase [Bacteroidales bacterium]